MVSLTRFSLRFPLSTLIALAIVSAALAWGLPRLKSEVGYRAFLGHDHPAVVRLDAFAERFVGGIPIVAVWSCRESAACRDVFDPESLAMAQAVTHQLEAVPGVRRVDSPATSALVVPQEIGLPQVRRLAPGGEPARDLDALSTRALEDPLWVGQIVSADGLAGAVIVHLESSQGNLATRVVAALELALAPFETRGFRFHLVGGPVEFVVAGEELATGTARVIPIMVALVAVVIVALFGSFAAAALALASMGVAVLWTFGAMAWLGWAQNSLTQALAPLVLVIGICNAIHVLAAYASRPQTADTRIERETVLLEVADDVGPACAMTTLTTAAGFASFAISGLESIARFGGLASFGVASAWLLCFTLLPQLLVRVPPGRLQGLNATRAWQRGATALASVGSRHAGIVLAGTAAVIAVCGVGLTRLRVDATFEDLYGSDSRVVRWARFVSENLRKPDTLEIGLTPPDGVAASAPQVLATLAALQDDLTSVEGLGRALSIVAPVRSLHRMLYHSELGFSPSDENAERTAALFRMMRRQDRSAFAMFVDEQAGMLRVSVESEKAPQDRLRRMLAQVQTLAALRVPAGWGVTLTGPLQVVHEMVDEIRTTQLRSFALAGVIVFALVTIYFRSLWLSAMAMVPTLLPVLVTLGALGLAGIALDVGGAMVAAVVLGLAVDDAIHLLVQVQRARLRGAGPSEAVGEAVRRVGRAIVTTSLALALGFFALALVPWQSVANFGLISTLAILCALISTLLVLPALVVAVDRLRGNSRSEPA